jgi:aspartyl-tRNA(Asn)/glutamyl-tRNA(Gln) amidotransferase subunit A
LSPNFPRLTVSQLLDVTRKAEGSPKAVLDFLEKSIAERDRDPRGIHAYVPGRLRRPIQRSTDKTSPLWGVPIAIKDNICVEGFEVTCASKILKNFVPPYHATVIEKLLDAGAVIYGQTNMDEFAFGSSCETSCYGPTRNPRDPDRVPGGSSGGSAAAVADHTAFAALGSDTGGSIRQPAAFCGVVGIKPTYGRVSRYGLIAFASSLDQIGPLTKDVRDAALILGAIAGHDPKDSTSADVPVPDYTAFLGRSIRGRKVGILSGAELKGLNPVVKGAAQERAVKVMEKLGAEVVEISLPNMRHSVSVYYIIAPSEASSNLARFDAVRFGHRSAAARSFLEMFEMSRGEGFGAEAKRRIILGTYSLSSGYYDAYYLKAMKVRTLIKRDFDEAFQKFDAIMLPTSPSAAFKIGEKIQDPLEMYLSDIFTICANLAGVPGISIPCGFDETRAGKPLPIGLQLLGRPFQEEVLFQMAYAFEQETGFHKKLGNVDS